MRENEEFLLESETICVKCFLKSKRVKGKKAIALYLGCTTLILKIASLSVEKKNKTLSSVNIKGGASLFSSVFLINYIITHSIKRGARKKTFIA